LSLRIPTVPVAATFIVSTGILVITFTRPLQPNAGDVLPLFGRRDDMAFGVFVWDTADGNYNAECEVLISDPGPAYVTWLGFPDLLEDTDGFPVPNFENFPLDVVP